MSNLQQILNDLICSALFLLFYYLIDELNVFFFIFNFLYQDKISIFYIIDNIFRKKEQYLEVFLF
jgi:hypothetical protein